MLMVTESETRTAMTTLRFSWSWPKRITRRISSLFKGVRSSRVTSSRGYDDDEEDFAVRSSPAIAVERHKSVSERMSRSDINDKGKRRATSRSVIIRNDSTPNMGSRREASIERWAWDASKSGKHDSDNYPHSRSSQGRPSSCGREHAGTPLPDDAMFLGAGGVCNDPSSLVSSNLPLGLNQSISNSAVVLRHPQPERLYIAASAAVVADPSSHDSGHSRHPVVRSATQSPSPLQQVAYESEPGDDDYDDDFDDASDSSFFRDTHKERQAESEALQANTSLMYDDDGEEEEGDEDEDEDESDEDPIEVKRRRPSVSVTAASLVHLSDFSD